MYFPTHNCVAHLSGWVGPKDRGMVRAFFGPEVGGMGVKLGRLDNYINKKLTRIIL